jgi:choline dehydrogenase-like flavoprotein
MVPGAYESDPPVDLFSAVLARIETLPPTHQQDLRTALGVFGHPLAAVIDGALPVRFSALDHIGQDARLQHWETSRLATRRTIFQALRRLIISTYYALPEGAADMGYRGPLRNRAPVVPWEGAWPQTDSRAPASSVIADFREVDTGYPASSDSADDARVRSPAARPAAAFGLKSAGFIDAANIATGSTLRCDVVVVGSGVGGAVAAARLAEAGLSVIVLEEGGHFTTADFTDSEREMIPRLYAESGARATDDASISLLQGRCVGGGGTVNWMLMLRPMPWVMDEWERSHGASLLGPAQLIPSLERIEREVGAGFIPDGAHSPGNRIILDGARTLGWKADEARINARGCVRAGTCGLGCSHGAKRSAGDVFLPRAIAAGARVISHARADRIESSSQRKRVRCTVVQPLTGEARGSLTVDAKRVVLAAGAVGTPAILHRSGMGGRPVGSFLRLHPTTAVRGLYDHSMYGAAGVPQSALLSEFIRGDDGYGFWIENPPMLPALASVATCGFGADHRAAMAAFPNTAALIVLTRDGAALSHSSGSVLVDRRDRVHIRYSTHPADRANIAKGIAAAARLHFAAGAREVITLHTPPIVMRSESDIAAVADAPLFPNRIALFSAHVNGTCRMGTDTRSSACDPDGQRHGHADVFVADGSVFPTAPGVNPQATIMALASLVAEGVAARP